MCHSVSIRDFRLQKCAAAKPPLLGEACTKSHLSDDTCELISDVYDIGLGFLTTIALGYFAFVIFSFIRELEGSTEDTEPVEDTSSSSADPAKDASDM